MAGYRYRPYRRTTRVSRSRNLKDFILSLIVIVVGVIILYRSRDTSRDEKIISTDAGQTGKESLTSFEFKPDGLSGRGTASELKPTRNRKQNLSQRRHQSLG